MRSSSPDLPSLFLEPSHFEEGRVRLPEDRWHYLARVLRLHEGASFWVLDGMGSRMEARMPPPDGRSREALVSEPHPAPGELPGHVTLVQAILKGDRQEWILQKATELGCHAIIPVITERTVVRLEAERIDRRLTRWNEIIREAAEQCERGRLPHLSTPMRLAESLPRPADCEESMWFGHPRDADIPPLIEAARSARERRFRLFIGPEGGFSPAEESWLRSRGVQPASLGSRILRAETACLAGLAQMASVLETR